LKVSQTGRRVAIHMLMNMVLQSCGLATVCLIAHFSARVTASDVANSMISEHEVFPRVVKRPQMLSTRSFPSREAFQRSGSRRLQAEGSKPARDVYVAEEAGHRFTYEYDGHAKGQILDVDHDPAIVALSCAVPIGTGAEYRMQLHWSTGGMPGIDASATRPALKRGDFVTGSSTWDCEWPSFGFLMEVLDVVSSETTDNRTTTVLVRSASPLHAVQDLYLDLQWAFPGRRLTAEPWKVDKQLPVARFNKILTAPSKQKKIDVGPFSCENCKGSFVPTLKFQMQTEGSKPKKVSLTLDTTLDVGMAVHLTDAAKEAIKKALNPATVKAAWEDLVAKEFGPDMLSSDQISGALPLFSVVTSALDIKLLPVFETQVRLFSDAADAFDEDFQVSVATTKKAGYTLAWDKTKGFSVDATFVDEKTTNDVSGIQKLWKLTAGLRTCLGLELQAAGGTKMTGMKSCPEMQFSAQNLLTSSTPEVPEELKANTVSLDGGDDYCFQFTDFDTDEELDNTRDEPYAKVCFFGVCKQTPHTNFPLLSNKVSFPQELCLKGPKALQDGSAHLHFMESDPTWDDQYTQPYKLDLKETSCSGIGTKAGCNKDLTLTPYKQGKYAKVKVKVVKTVSRRLTASERRLQNQCQGAAITGQMGVGSSFDGFSFPSNFNKGGGQQIVDPVNAPTYNPAGPVTKCLGTETASLATTMTSPALSLVVLVVAFLVVGFGS